MKRWKAFPLAALLTLTICTFTACGMYDGTAADESGTVEKRNTVNEQTDETDILDNTDNNGVLDDSADRERIETDREATDPDLNDKEDDTVIGELGNGVESVGDGIGDAVENVGDGLGEAAENVGDAVDNATDGR